jgi:tetratricopeptide (TPR) repeat protein
MKGLFAVLVLLSTLAWAKAPSDEKYIGDQHPEDAKKAQKHSENSLDVQTWRMAPPPPWDATPTELELKGDQLRAEKAPADALDYYRAALEKTPKKQRAVLYNKCGITELHLGRYDDAERDFVNALKRNKKYAEAMNNLGVVYYLQHRYGKAQKAYKKAIDTDSSSASFHSNLGRAYFADKKYDLASGEYSQALELDPDIFTRESPAGISARVPQEKGLLSFVLAKLLATHGKIEESIVYLRRAMDDGYKGVDKIYTEPEFAKVIKDPRFTEMMNARNQGQPTPPQ